MCNSLAFSFTSITSIQFPNISSPTRDLMLRLLLLLLKIFLKFFSLCNLLGRNINNLRYADDTTLMAESEEELKSLLMKVKVESEKVGLKLNIQKRKIMASGPITSWEIDGLNSGNSGRLYFFGLQNHCRW